ncbi:MAG: hypothetical protein HY814_13685 [Candidatus Riflebacteria bacterium]|nr:hypothetical protein [Candidatus Riflebacteria bacterium]
MRAVTSTRLRTALVVLVSMLCATPGIVPPGCRLVLADDSPSFDGLETSRPRAGRSLPSWSSQFSPTIVFLGDSFTEGPGLAPAETYPALIQEKLDEAGIPLTVINAGVGGNTASEGLARLDYWLARKPLFLVVNFGTNDANGATTAPAVTSEWLRVNLDWIVKRALAKKTCVVLMPTKLPPSHDPALVAGFKAAFEAVSRDNQVPLGPGLLDGVWGDEKLWLRNGHPNAMGHRVIAGNVWHALEPELERRLGR